VIERVQLATRFVIPVCVGTVRMNADGLAAQRNPKVAPEASTRLRRVDQSRGKSKDTVISRRLLSNCDEFCRGFA